MRRGARDVGALSLVKLYEAMEYACVEKIVAEMNQLARRYCDDDLTESTNRVEEHLRKEAEKRTVVPLKGETA